MKDEVKEIQERLNYHKSIGIEPEYCEDLIITGELQRLLDYITNLQEENERLKKENTKLYKKDIKIINELKEELETTEEKWNKDKQFSKCRTMEMLDYKSRNEKAIECINHYAVENEDYSKIYNDEEKDLLNILNGGDK